MNIPARDFYLIQVWQSPGPQSMALGKCRVHHPVLMYYNSPFPDWRRQISTNNYIAPFTVDYWFEVKKHMFTTPNNLTYKFALSDGWIFVIPHL